MDHDPAQPTIEKPAAPPLPRTEKEYLEEQARAARLAMGRALSDVKSDLKEAVSPSAWVEEYPWASCAVSAAAGLAAGYFLVPPRGESAADRWQDLVSRFSSAQDGKAQPAAAAPPSPPPRKPILASLAGVAVTGAFKLLSSAINTAITGARQAEIAASLNGRERVASRAAASEE
jgi:hypothetical protein